MFDWAIGGLSSLFGWVGDGVGAVAGWAWDKVIVGIFTWLANGLALLVEWVWSVLDAGTTPRVTQDWFRNELALHVGVIALASTVALMLASAMQAALVGRPEQIVDAVRHAVWSIIAAALTVTVIDVLIRVVDEAAAVVWHSGRSDLVSMIEGMIVVATTTTALGSTFVGPLCLLIGFLGLIGLVVSLMMRSALIYMAAALAPLVWSVNVLPSFRGAARKLIHLTVALVISKLAIVVTLTLAVKLIANPSGDPSSAAIINDGAAAVGQLMTGFIAFLIAAVTPVILYRLMPTVEGAAAGSGVAGGWGRSTAAIVSAGLMVKSLGAAGAASAATRPAAGQHGAAGATGGLVPRGAIAGLTGAAATPSASGTPNPAGGQTPRAPDTGVTPARAQRPASGHSGVLTVGTNRRADEQRDE